MLVFLVSSTIAGTKWSWSWSWSGKQWSLLQQVSVKIQFQLLQLEYETETININKYWWIIELYVEWIFHLNFHFLLIIDLQFLHEVGEYFSGLDFKGIPLFFRARLFWLLRTWLYLVFIGEQRLHLLQSLNNWVRLVNN